MLSFDQAFRARNDLSMQARLGLFLILMLYICRPIDAAAYVQQLQQQEWLQRTLAYQTMQQHMYGIHPMNQPQYASQEQFRGYYQPTDVQSCGKNQKGKRPRNQHKNNTGAAAADKAGSKRSHDHDRRLMSVKKSQQEHLSEKRPHGHKQTTDRRARGKNAKQQPQKQQSKQNVAAVTADEVQKAPLRVKSKQTKKRNKKQTKKTNRKDKEKNSRKRNNEASKKANNKANQKQNSKTVNAFAALEQSDSEDES